MRKTKQFSFKSFYLTTTRARIIVFCLCMCVFFVLHLFGCCFESIPEVLSIFIIRRYGGQTEVFWLKRQMALNSREKRCKFAFPFFSVCNLVSCVDSWTCALSFISKQPWPFVLFAQDFFNSV